MAQEIGGKYLLERELARGGMGSIWVAFDTKLRRRVALKLMSLDQVSSTSSKERFEREAMAIAQLRNPHVIQVYDYGINDNAPYIVMELLDGEDLDSRLRKRGRLPLSTVNTILLQASRALGAAHGVGIIHRDLKPANIFIVAGEGGEHVKILDFGVVALVNGQAEAWNDITRVGMLVGTPAYMSPEQARGKPVDTRSDLWSLAVVAYKSLTAQLPFAAAAIGEIIVQICTGTHAPPSSFVPSLSSEVDAFFERALAKDPSHRFQSVGEMAAAFAALAEAEGPLRTTQILVIDDEPDVKMLIEQRFKQQIKRNVYQFTFATDGLGALEELRRNPELEVALSDINMPGMDGLTFLRQAAEVSPLLKVIMVSAYSDTANFRAAMNRGAIDFLVKPIDFKDLEATIENAARRAREVRRSIRAMEENGLLRLFVNDGIVDRLLPVIRSADSLAGEFVHGTVVFIDLHGFQERSRALAADAVIRLINANFEIIVPELTARGGVVDKYIGDAVMALFQGKDHAVRAVEACLAVRTELTRMVDRVGEDSPYSCGVSIGVASGEMISGSIGSRSMGRLDYTVLGEVVARAARLSERAARGQILVDEALCDTVQGFFICEENGSVAEPGTSEVRVFNVLETIAGDAASVAQLPTVALERTSSSSIKPPKP
ncbi:protein kinase domain-containing protein [Chondromyces apiculatus]|uniref:Adenylate cyclase n=1 Tax=Chondromyces apiculatus DSM 436 TaxID=1192034 RepID=A0A017SUC8_9BACT|nr:protein kinase [Chondromyces apiculatus]EYF00220.1 Adenylate cyclase [Chondromyces apiculatus DSM 436]